MHPNVEELGISLASTSSSSIRHCSQNLFCNTSYLWLELEMLCHNLFFKSWQLIFIWADLFFCTLLLNVCHISFKCSPLRQSLGQFWTDLI